MWQIQQLKMIDQLGDWNMNVKTWKHTVCPRTHTINPLVVLEETQDDNTPIPWSRLNQNQTPRQKTH